jgi:hypothetical protein
MALTHLQMGKSKRARPSGERSPSPVAYNDTKAGNNDVERANSKRPRLRKGLSYDNVITTPRRSPSAPPTSPTSHSHRTREGLRGRTKVNYDMRFHPADEILRPNYPATRAARQTLEGSESDSAADEDRSGDHDDEAEEKSQIPSSSPRRETKPLEHRSTRTGRQVKVANYDMKHHPMDDVLRPKAAAKRSVRFSGLASSSQSKSTTETDTRTTPAPSPAATFDNPFTKPVLEDWHQLGKFDRRLYQLQDAAPLKSKILPLRWPEVVKRLIDENLLSNEQLGACGGYAALQARYEDVRVAVRASFGPTVEDEPKTNGELKWMHAEDFSVFDLPSGQKYWRHKRDSFVAKQTDVKSKIAVLNHSSEEDSVGKASKTAAKSEHLPVPASEGTVEEPVSLPEADVTLMQNMRNDITASIQTFMSEDEVDELISRHDEVHSRPIDAAPNSQVINAGAPASITSDDDNLPLSPNAPPGVRRAALRLRKTKRAQKKQKKLSLAENKLKEQHSLHADAEKSSKTTKPDYKTTPRYQFSGVVIEKSRPSSGEDSSSIDTETLLKAKTVDKKRTQPRKQFRVHEDRPSQTPLNEEQTFAYPTSPGTDLPKENLTEEMLNNNTNNVLSSPSAASHDRLQLATMHPSYMSHTPSPTMPASARSSYQTILGSPNTTIPALPRPTYPTDPTVTVFTPINLGRPRPVASDSLSH